MDRRSQVPRCGRWVSVGGAHGDGSSGRKPREMDGGFWACATLVVELKLTVVSFQLTWGFLTVKQRRLYIFGFARIPSHVQIISSWQTSRGLSRVRHRSSGWTLTFRILRGEEKTFGLGRAFQIAEETCQSQRATLPQIIRHRAQAVIKQIGAMRESRSQRFPIRKSPNDAIGSFLSCGRDSLRKPCWISGSRFHSSSGPH